jgi:hypothetical protein
MQGIPKLDISLLARRRALPVILQSEMAECGLACLAMVSSYHGFEYDLVGLRNKHQLSLTGANLKNLIEIAEHLNLSARPLKVPLERLGALKAPAVLHWDLNHFVVLERVSDRQVDIVDPSRGRVRLDIDEVSKHYTGIALELVPTEEFVFGAEVDLTSWSALPLRALLFGEAQGRVIVSTPNAAAVLAAAKKHGVPARGIGKVVKAQSLRMKIGDRTIDAPLATLAEAYHEAIPRRMSRGAQPLEVAFAASPA